MTSKPWKRAPSTPVTERYYRALSELTEPNPKESDGDRDPGFELRRRDLIRLLGASAALAGLSACRRAPPEKILPYVRTPPDVRPGIPVEYATTMLQAGFGIGVLGVVHDGRPIKLDGNPAHPSAPGSSSLWQQAAILDLYDPARLTQPMHRHLPTSWHAADAALSQAGPRIWFVLPPHGSPLLARQLARARERLPQARFCYYSALSRAPVYDAAQRAFGRRLETLPDLSRAPTVLALDADFAVGSAGSLRLAADFAKRRRLAAPSDAMSRLYVAEAMLSPSGSLADHRLAVPSHRMAWLANAVLRELYRLGRRAGELELDLSPNAAAGTLEDFAQAAARDLAQRTGVVLVGERQPAETHLLGHAINVALGNFGQAVRFIESPLSAPAASESLENLASALGAGEVDALVILEEDLLHSAPPDLELSRLVPLARQRFHLTYGANATSRSCEWCLPLAHFLESWGDARAVDGTLSYTQPLIAPLHDAKSAAEVLAVFAGRPGASGQQLLLELYREQLDPRDFDAEWRRRLEAGVVSGSASPSVDVELRADAVRDATQAVRRTVFADGAIELNFTLGNVHDGRFANNAWLLELPHPMTKQCWGNAAVLSPSTAKRLGIESGRVLLLSAGKRRLRVPALVLPGHADGALSLDVGYGSDGEGLGRGVGVNAYALRPAADAAYRTDARVTVTADREELAITQEHFRLQGREYVMSATLDEYRRSPNLGRPPRQAQLSLLPQVGRAGTQWAMTIDTMLCSGCSACVVACQAENNIPVVGKRGVQKSREMHWLRIDRYFSGDVRRPSVLNQPMLCQHCEKAPCEYVCPVNATVHSPDGLNEMVYNRCVGTRFCSNNCPYKVRRFNWLEYTADSSSSRLQKNPEVTVRERGVMEKCTFCVQRIRRAEGRARLEQRAARSEDVVTACQAACPMQAIQFGSLDAGESPMLTWRKEGRSYAALDELATRPRVRYLAKISNPNPDLQK